ncbi:magnesium/cobalt transporter CorA [soil metagenome]
MIVDCAVYESGLRREGVVSLDEAMETATSRPDGFVWIGVHEPGAKEFDSLATEFKLHPLAVEDAVHAHQRPKLEVYGDTIFVVLNTVRYVDSVEVVEIGQVMLFIGAGFVVSVRHGTSNALSEVRSELETDPERLQWGPSAVLHAVADKVVDQYGVVARGLDNDVDEIESQVFSDDRLSHAQRIYKRKREVLEFRRAVAPLAEPLDNLACGRVPHLDEHVRHYFRDVHDHLLRESEHVEGLDVLLTGALNANLANVGVRQNEDMRKISAWVAIIALPTMIAGIYGMNFDHMPELGWQLGYPFALVLMAASCSVLYGIFKRRGWL